MNNLRNKQLLERFGARLKELRRAKGMTLTDLAYSCEMELSQVHRIEQGKLNATISTLAALASGLEITLSELVKDVEN